MFKFDCEGKALVLAYTNMTATDVVGIKMLNTICDVWK